jgi:outer membrane immunogenic protein
MKRLLLASVTLLALTGTQAALAADLPPGVVYPAVAPRFTFTGFYVGGTVGGVLAGSNYIEAPSGAFGPAFSPSIAAAGSSSVSPRGVIGGIEAGYNWQAGMFVLGFETDFSGWDLSSSNGVSSSLPTALSSATKISSNWLFTARPRMGIANGNMLTYLTAGLAVSNVSLSQSIILTGVGPTLAGSASSTQLGWTAGGGVEYALMWNWFIKAEYLYFSYSNQSAAQVSGGAGTGTVTGNLRGSIARAGFDYRF